jgi:hypothetical protein
MKRMFYFSVAVLVALILAWLGTRLLFFSAQAAGHAAFLLTGLALFAGGLSTLGKTPWEATIVLILFGFYLCARAAGIIEDPWLGRVVGSLAWLMALALLYFMWPAHQRNPLSRFESHTPVNT